MTFDPIFVDEYSEDRPSDWNALAASGLPWAGGLLKASQGLTYSSGDWLKQNWAALETARTRSFRTDFIRGLYHYLTIADDGAEQAKFFLSVANEAGGFQLGDLWPVMDVESADNGDPSSQQIIDCGCAFTETIKIETGLDTMLYGGSFLYDHGITNRLGCSNLWIARYTATLPENVVTRIGWTEDLLWGWQYRGSPYNSQLKTPDGEMYPDSAPGCGAVDLTVLTYPGGLDALCAKLWGKSV
jgi:GH25 family lysozyme M1 (1,4-beta-N-acetylmuramidase)